MASIHENYTISDNLNENFTGSKAFKWAQNIKKRNRDKRAKSRDAFQSLFDPNKAISNAIANAQKTKKSNIFQSVIDEQKRIADARKTKINNALQFAIDAKKAKDYSRSQVIAGRALAIRKLKRDIYRNRHKPSIIQLAVQNYKKQLQNIIKKIKKKRNLYLRNLRKKYWRQRYLRQRHSRPKYFNMGRHRRRRYNIMDIALNKTKIQQEKLENDINKSIANNNNSLKNINNINSYLNNTSENFVINDVEYDPPVRSDREEVIKDWEFNRDLSNTYKQINKSTESLQRARYVNKEKKALEQAIANNSVIADLMAKKKSRNIVNTKSRIVDINNNNFRTKQILVTRLMYVIYFILYSIGLGISLATGLLTMRILGYAFIIGAIFLVISLLMSGSFMKSYGDTTMKIAKETTKAVIGKCPDRCQTKHNYEQHKLNFPNTNSNNNNTESGSICTLKET